MKCAFCFKEQETLIEVHGYGVCDWNCGLKLKNVTDNLYVNWRHDKLTKGDKR